MKPMLATDLKLDSPLHRQIAACPNQWAMEIKFDGMRAVIEVLADGSIGAFTSRTGKPVGQKVPHLLNVFKHFQPGWYDMELGFPKEDTEFLQLDFNRTMRILGSDFPKARRDQADHGYIHAYVFDYFDPMRPKMPQDERTHLIFENWARNINMWVHKTDQYRFSAFEDFETEFNAWVADGGEGAMLKNVNGVYVPGQRSKSWVKWKKYETLDVYVTGFEWGMGKYDGLMGALYFSYTSDGPAIGKCSGMTDAERIEWTNLFASYDDVILSIPAEDRLIEVKHYGKLKDGFRHPQYVKWKKPE
jgi:ATP-dependent DNA ligase